MKSLKKTLALNGILAATIALSGCSQSSLPENSISYEQSDSTQSSESALESFVNLVSGISEDSTREQIITMMQSEPTGTDEFENQEILSWEIADVDVNVQFIENRLQRVMLINFGESATIDQPSANQFVGVHLEYLLENLGTPQTLLFALDSIDYSPGLLSYPTEEPNVTIRIWFSHELIVEYVEVSRH